MRNNASYARRIWLPTLVIGLLVSSALGIASVVLLGTARGVNSMHLVSAVSIGLNAALGFAVFRLARAGRAGAG